MDDRLKETGPVDEQRDAHGRWTTGADDDVPDQDYPNVTVKDRRENPRMESYEIELSKALAKGELETTVLKNGEMVPDPDRGL